ncbi:hypothetical protein PHMEG_00031364 [Phytophthora megakarya]|uniref:Uncharacterized protein n=1 Tax=Phytophthora megakarya TaxID=4795 RepID=A0A225UWW7_9STRA|nr:hypothetical protein PHMEG_00031364 [Phytophthora megakarya]
MNAVRTPLMLAADAGNTFIVGQLLKQGAPMDDQLPSGHSALMLACENGRVNAVQVLLAHGADATLTTRAGFNALMVACVCTAAPLWCLCCWLTKSQSTTNAALCCVSTRIY